MQCPFCKEEIQDGAIKCKHCQSMLNGSSESKPIISQISVLGKWLLIGIFALSILAFFFPNVSITVPILGKMNYSMYDVVKKFGVNDQQPSDISDIEKVKKPNLPDILSKLGKSEEDDSKNKAGSISLIFFTLAIAGLALHYLFTIIWGVCTFVIHKTFRLLNIVWLGLAVQFPIIFAIGGQIIISDMKSEMANEAGADNPFAALGAAIADSFSISPGIILWVLMIMAGIGLAMHLIDKQMGISCADGDAANLKENASVKGNKWKKPAIIVGAVALGIALLIISIFTVSDNKSTKNQSVNAEQTQPDKGKTDPYMSAPGAPPPPTSDDALSTVPSPALSSYKNLPEYKSAYECAIESFKEGYGAGPVAYCVGNSRDPSEIEAQAYDDAERDFFK